MRHSPTWLCRSWRIASLSIRPRIWSRSFASIVNGTSPVFREEAVRLREYQEECIQSVLSYLRNGHKRLGISLATGSGKTVIFTQLIDRIKPIKPNADQTLILAHQRELVEQAARHCARAYPDKSIEIEMGDQHASGDADITIASIRSLQSGMRLENYDPEAFKLVLVDEAHHIVAPGYLEVLEHFGLNVLRTNSPALVGVSATFSRFDGLRLGAVIDHIVYHKDYVDMIGEKWLCDVVFTTIRSNVNLSKVKSNKDGDFATGQLSKAVNTPETNEITVKSWLSEAGERKSTLVFCVDLNHVASLTDMFRKHGIDARYITGDTAKQIRGERLEAFRNREFPVLLNCGVFTEGTDIPNIDCVLLARPTKSRNLLVQMIGRGMRLHPDKQNCHVIDMVASLETGIVTIPTLFGLDPGEMVESASSQDLREKKEKLEEEAVLHSSEPLDILNASDGSSIANANLTFTHYDSVQDLIEDTSGERHVRAISPNAWVQVDNNKYILAARGGVLTLERRLPDKEVSTAKVPARMNESTSDPSSETKAESDTPQPPRQQTPLFHVYYKFELPPTEKSRAPFSKPRLIVTSPTLALALNAADTFAATKFERLFIATSSSWRKSPASEGQLSFLNKLRYVGDEAPLTSDDLTKGQAGDMITKIKFGARGRFDRLQKSGRKIARERERVEELRAREEVRVGPVEA